MKPCPSCGGPDEAQARTAVEILPTLVAPTVERQTLTLTEAATVLGISRASAYKLARTGEFPVRVLRIAGLLKVSRHELERYLRVEE